MEAMNSYTQGAYSLGSWSQHKKWLLHDMLSNKTSLHDERIINDCASGLGTMQDCCMFSGFPHVLWTFWTLQGCLSQDQRNRRR
ncbi:hypothetical protein RIF29_11270 [Crotalaria pallida]|uniref:Uncharacterized protein n=1 Tax=Crotalaria pallida TaxID=3830 RepID=A0AAN9ILY6_CROPI